MQDPHLHGPAIAINLMSDTCGPTPTGITVIPRSINSLAATWARFKLVILSSDGTADPSYTDGFPSVMMYTDVLSLGTILRAASQFV
jgi:hypothetical protein